MTIRAARRIVLPLILLGVGIWLLTGCFFLPLPEHRTDSHQKDFRELFGKDNGARRFAPGSITRAQVEAALGSARFVSDDGHAIGYTLETQRGAWVWPLCFSARPAKLRLYTLRLQFDEHDVLSDWRVVQLDRNEGWYIATGQILPSEGIDQMNAQHDGPKLKDRSAPVAPVRPMTRP